MLVFFDLVFHLPTVPLVCPVVSIWWEAEVIDLLNAFPPALWTCDPEPERWFVDFITSCVTIPGIDRARMEVRNIPIPTEWFAQGGKDWYDRLMVEFDAFDAPPVLINLGPPYEASRGRTELCRWVRSENKWRRPSSG
jgi:hypothetical protein